jgi:hypothetical protein
MQDDNQNSLETSRQIKQLRRTFLSAVYGLQRPRELAGEFDAQVRTNLFYGADVEIGHSGLSSMG